MRYVVVTGAGRGLGLEIVKAHIQKGDYVYALSRKRTEGLENLPQEKLCILFCELTEEVSVKAAVKEIAHPIDILYNNAGINHEAGHSTLDKTDFITALEEYNVNALGPLRILKHMESKLSCSAVVLNISSEAGSISQQDRTEEYGYAMSKAALNMATRIFKNSHPSLFIYSYHPGWVRTDMGGAEAKNSPYGIDTNTAAECALSITLHPEDYKNSLFWDFKGNPLKW